MLSLLVVALTAGLCLGQKINEFSDCAQAPEIMTQCADDHLSYVLEVLHEEQRKQIKNLEVCTLPDILLPMLDTICSDPMKLRAYYYCAFYNMTSCLANNNSTQLEGISDANNIADGIVELCENRKDMNKTCLMAALDEVIYCFSTFMGKNEDATPCQVYDGRLSCADEKLNGCDGDEDVRKFLVDAKPLNCEDTSSVPQFLPSVLVLAGALLVHFIRMQ